jgi:sulfur carrier protein
MQIHVNGSPTQVADTCTLALLIEGLDLAGRRLAVEVNEELVPRSRFAEHPLAPGDRVEIIHAVGGG